ncbi:MAG: flagellin lysine-N-methylase [Clostridia bacterium]|nr:flagellin lysine-N-methylase [Clostridia bacterium]
MKTYAPDYYKNFKCIAEKCLHNCCIGWEIDIDKETLEKYENQKGAFSRKLKNGIKKCGDYSCFHLDGKGRCVFLNENNLCEIILNMGEASLCQICSDHPRFRNYFSNRIEIGLGLCCEEAGRIILSQDKAFSLEIIDEDNDEFTETDEEIAFFKFREELMNKIYNGGTVLDFCESSFPEKTVNEWADLYLSLERLDEHWTIILNDLKEIDISDVEFPESFDRAFKNLTGYFTYRFLNEFSTENELMFIHLSCEMIKNISKMHIKKYEVLHLDDIVEYARMYSSEIEYSDENIEIIIQELFA